MTSHDVVDAVRRVSGQRKVGHAGTLDPMATGVLLVCLGHATRVAEYLMAGKKAYRANIVLGTTTDTYDADGEIVSSGGPAGFSRAEIEEALAAFVGRIQQVPPVYSAIKQGGQPLHRLAREGKSVKPKARTVEIEEIRLLDWVPPSQEDGVLLEAVSPRANEGAVTIEVKCSPGTYVRSLAHELGQRLGSGAYLAGLVRLSSGHFTLEEAVSLGRLEEAFRHEQEDEYLLPLDEALLDLPAVILASKDVRRLTQGQPVQTDLESPSHSTTDIDGRWLYRVYSLDGEFLAIARYDPESQGLWPKKVFAPG
jgi:tRNA pseudouridine55 synthase